MYPLRQLHQCLPHGPFACVDLGGEMLDKLMVDLCIGCGTCSYVCPAKRPVTQTMNLAKAVWQKNKNGGKK